MSSHNIKKPAQKIQPTSSRPVVAEVERKVDPANASSANPVNAVTDTIKEFTSARKDEVMKNQAKSQEQAFTFGVNAMEKVSECVEKTAHQINEVIATGKEQMDALMESGKIASCLSKELHESLIEEVNAMFSENVSLSKELLNCRTLNDVLEIQNRAVQNNFVRFFDQSAKMAEVWFKLATEAAEPINTHATQAVAKVNKALAA